MRIDEFHMLEQYMLDVMRDSAHDRLHIYRVLNTALEIAGTEENVNYNVLIAACVLHDVGRELQFKDPSVDHAEAGAKMAYDLLTWMGWREADASCVSSCIYTHRFRNDLCPESLEAKILFDADKLDVSGALGMARTLIYAGIVSEPLYIMDASGDIVTEASNADKSSFFQEFEYKQRHLYDSFFTKKAAEIGATRKKAAFDFRDNLFNEISATNSWGSKHLSRLLEE